MLTICDYDYNNNYREFENDEHLFHNALKYVLHGEKRFHVHNQDADDFDMIYIENDIKAKTDSTFPDSEFFRSELIYPPYYFYNENDLDKISLFMFDGYDEVYFEDVNEYSVVITRLLIKHTDLKVNFKDSRIWLFNDLRDRVGLKYKPDTENPIYVHKSFYGIYDQNDQFDTIGLFHCLFSLQWISDLPMDKLKYLEFTVRKTEGIGSLLSCIKRVSLAYGKKSIKVFTKAGSTRYSDKMLSKYFTIDTKPEDADETNTAFVSCFNAFILNNFVQRYEARLDLSMLKPSFIEEMNEYAEALFDGEKVLGVLLRGTDIAISGFVGAYRPVSIQESIDDIREKMEQYGYTRIFVATEDSSLLEAMLDAFPGKVFAVSQERHRVEDFKKVKYISDLEKSEKTGESYLASVDDTTVNYLYAMYMLSKCDSLVSNCMCSGVNLATSFNEGRYTRVDIQSKNTV